MVVVTAVTEIACDQKATCDGTKQSRKLQQAIAVTAVTEIAWFRN